jgi:L-alanine-DL-glutamate epimerase-like enolase superfamily enzyme
MPAGIRFGARRGVVLELETDACITGVDHGTRVSEETFEEEATQYAEEGFDAVKLRFKYGPEAGREGMRENEEIVATVRDAVGDDVAIAGDAVGSDVNYATEMVERLEPYDMAWTEEPVIPDAIDGYAAVREAAPMPISGGEHEFTRWGHRELLEREAVDILQPDVHRAGGITEMKKIVDIAEAPRRPSDPPRRHEPELHLIAGSTNLPMAEYFPVPEWFKREQRQADKESTYSDVIYANPPQAEDGAIALPDRPGVGLELNEAGLAEFAVE